MLAGILRPAVGMLLLALLVVLSPQPAGATEEYAQQTGQACAVCHLDPAGGGELTAAGATFSLARESRPDHRVPGVLGRRLRLAVGYVHLLTAIFWFGTILYVHLVLKPAYAARGLPRGEVRVGLVSMVIMGLSGAVLAYYRVPSFDALLHTRFGILLLIKASLYLVMVCSALVVVTLIGPRLRRQGKEPSFAAGTGDMTSEQLASCSGEEGRPAYFAFEGTIYDATGSGFWNQGLHMGRHQAGTDLTEALKLAPHGRGRVTAMRVVGKLVAAEPREVPLQERAFLVMAYVNLVFVFVITLIVALWRWW